jgi:hypothetical protein
MLVMKRRIFARLGLAMLGGMTMTPRPTGAAEATPAALLAAWRWKSRVLLIFAPDDGNPRLAAQREHLAAATAKSAERDLVVIEIVGGHANQAVDGAALRARFRVAAEAFAVVLIGKDSGEKLRRAEPISSASLFGVIDAMPMRRHEAAQR